MENGAPIQGMLAIRARAAATDAGTLHLQGGMELGGEWQ